MEAISTFGGMVAGGTAGFVLGWIVYVPFAKDEGAPIVGFLRASIGALIGGMIAARASRNSN